MSLGSVENVEVHDKCYLREIPIAAAKKKQEDLASVRSNRQIKNAFNFQNVYVIYDKKAGDENATQLRTNGRLSIGN